MMEHSYFWKDVHKILRFVSAVIECTAWYYFYLHVAFYILCQFELQLVLWGSGTFFMLSINCPCWSHVCSSTIF